jgi:nucleotide-binding universal stress UspA family protein
MEEIFVMIKRILFPTKFDEFNLEALKTLLDLKQAGLEEVILTHIIPRDEVAFVPFGGYQKNEEKRLREEARLRFEDWQDDLARSGVGTKVLIEVGDPVPEIMKLAEAEKVDLIVSGRTKRTSLERIYAGSRTLDLLRRIASIPVLVSKYMLFCDIDGECIRRLNEHPFQRPLFASDWLLPSEHALQFVIALQGVVQKVDVAHVVAINSSRDHDTSAWQRIEAESKDHLNRYCHILQKAGIESEPHLVPGDTASEILQLSRELNSTMIILGTTGKGRIHALFLGSLSQQIAEASELPTLLTP